MGLRPKTPTKSLNTRKANYMTITSEAFTGFLFCSLIIIQMVIAVIFIRRYGGGNPFYDALAIFKGIFITLLFIGVVIVPITRFGEAHYEYSKPKTIYTAKSNDHLSITNFQNRLTSRVTNSDILSPSDYKAMDTVNVNVVTTKSKKTYEFEQVKTPKVKTNTTISKASVTHVVKTQKCWFITLKDEYDRLDLETTPTQARATTD